MSRPPAGLPERLPTGERLLWQGTPEWRALALRGFHLRGWAIYFAILLAWYVISTLQHSPSLAEAAVASSRILGLALVPLLLIALYAWAIQRSTTYTITDRRLVIRLGLALPMTINLPFSRIESMAFHAARDGTGDIALELTSGDKLAYFVLWPHARPWRMAKPQPMLRAIGEAQAVAQLLARTLAASADMSIPAAAQLQEQRQPDRIPANRPRVAASA